MAGFVPTEGEVLVGQLVNKRSQTDRDATLQLGLFTNSSVSAATALTAITEPTGTGYARITLTDASWSNTTNQFTYAQQTFTAGGTWTGTVKGYFICSIAAGGTARLLALEVDASGPYTFNNGDTYKITPKFTYS